MSRAKQALFYAGTAALVLGAVELASFLFVRLRGERFTFFEPAGYTIDPAELPNLRRAFDAELGWQEHYATEFGERPRPADYPTSLLAAFGDSYTHCDQVDDDETWPAYLAAAIDRNVFNFGSGGYGTDQAYLRFLRDYPRVRTPLVSLGLIPENINRVVSVYRKFYYPRTGIPATKPRFVLERSGLRLIENPIQSSADLDRLRDPGFVARLGRYDHWYNPGGLPLRAFPFSAIWFNRCFRRELVGHLEHSISDIDPQPWAQLWRQPDARRLMFALLDRFEAQVRSHGAIPIFVVLARKSEVRYRVVTGRHPEQLGILTAYLRRRGYNLFDAAEALASEAGSPKRLDRFYNNHLSARGNQVVAEHLRRYLDSRGWLATRP